MHALFKMLKKFLLKSGIGALILWTLFLFIYNTHVLPLQNWDEAFYADTTRSMLIHRDFIAPYWNEELFLDKPPLYFWLSSIATSILGQTEFAYRVTSISASLAILYYTFRYILTRYALVPALVGHLFLISNTLFLWRGRTGNLDTLATLWIFLSFLVIQKDSSRFKYLYWGIIVGLTFLTKASLAFYLFPVMLIDFWYEKKKSFKHILRVTGHTLAGIGATAGIWLVLYYVQEGPRALSYFLFKSDQGVAHISLTMYSIEYLRFLLYSSTTLFFILSLSGFALLIFTRRRLPKHVVLLAYYGLALVGALLLSPIKHNWYLVPVLPFWAIATAESVHRFMRFIQSHHIRPLHITGFALCLILVGGMYYGKMLTHEIQPLLFDTTTTAQKDVAMRAGNIARHAQAKIVRLDHAYPVAVYYSSHKVYSSPHDQLSSNHFFIPRKQLMSIIQLEKIVLIGNDKDVSEVMRQSPAPFTITYTNSHQVLATNF